MHFLNLIALLYFAIWLFGGTIVMRDARWQPPHIRSIALIATLLGPITIFLYVGLRVSGHALASRFNLTHSTTMPNRPALRHRDTTH